MFWGVIILIYGIIGFAIMILKFFI